MAAPASSRALGILTRDLLIAAVSAALLFVLFAVVNERFLRALNPGQVLLLEAGAVVLVAVLLSRAITNATDAVLRQHGLAPRGHAVRLVLNVLIATAAVLALFKLAGVSIESIFIGAGFAGIVLGLASQTVLSNVFAGILLVFADPFRPGDRVALIASQYGMIPPSYPHEAAPPSYAGIVEDVGLTYTVLALDGGGFAKVPNGIVIQAMVVVARGPLVHRVRLTVPRSVPIATLEGALEEIAQELPPPYAGAPLPRLEATDISATTWDAVVIVHTTLRDPGAVRDKVLRRLLPRLAPAPAA